MKHAEQFVPLPAGEPLRLCWPTPNRNLFDKPEMFFARTRVNADYGRPGWTRDCGQRFHRGCDIAAIAPRKTGGTVSVTFTDCAKGIEYPSEEPALEADDQIFAVAAGVVVEIHTDETASLFGTHVVLEHRWPAGGKPFFTLYAHLQGIEVAIHAAVAAGARIGRMGRTSSSEDAKKWMAVAPHLHFETWDHLRRAYDPEAFLRTFLPRAQGSGHADVLPVSRFQ